MMAIMSSDCIHRPGMTRLLTRWLGSLDKWGTDCGQFVPGEAG